MIATLPEPEISDFEVMPENWTAVTLFLASSTQWRFAGMAGVQVGLDYAGVEAAARLSGIAATPDTFDRLRIMESAAIGALVERRQ